MNKELPDSLGGKLKEEGVLDLTDFHRLFCPYSDVGDVFVDGVLSEVVDKVEIPSDVDKGEAIDYIEWTVDRDGKCHGYKLRYSGGEVIGCQLYVHGKEHGLSRQYCLEWGIVGCYVMDMGTGVSLWYDDDGELSEEMCWVDGELHGPCRSWWGSDKVWREGHYFRGKRHGVFRKWNQQGQLSEPGGRIEFFVDGEEVSKEKYLACLDCDGTLPLYFDVDDGPARERFVFAAPWSL